MNKLQSAFDGIRAGEKLKMETLARLQSRISEGEDSRKNHRVPIRRFVAALACLVLVAVAGMTFSNVYFTEALYLDMDINPSVALAVNRFGRVIGASAYNAEGDQLLSRLKLLHKPYAAAAGLFTEAAIQNGYLPEGGLVSVTLQSEDPDREGVLAEALRADLASTVGSHHAEARVDVFSVDGETRLHAHDLNLSPAKYLAIQELREVDPTATVESCRGHTLGEIRERAAQHSGGRHSAQEDETGQPGNRVHHGNGHSG